MPELPEVHGYKVYIDSTCLHKTIIAMDCRDTKMLKKPKKDFDTYLIGGHKRVGRVVYRTAHDHAITDLVIGLAALLSPPVQVFPVKKGYPGGVVFFGLGTAYCGKCR